MSADRVYKQAIKRVFGEKYQMNEWSCTGVEATIRST
jgi:hypothetical protein